MSTPAMVKRARSQINCTAKRGVRKMAKKLRISESSERKSAHCKPGCLYQGNTALLVNCRDTIRETAGLNPYA